MYVLHSVAREFDGECYVARATRERDGRQGDLAAMWTDDRGFVASFHNGEFEERIAYGAAQLHGYLAAAWSLARAHV